MKKEGLECLILAGVVLFGLANVVLTFESMQCKKGSDEQLRLLRSIDKKLRK